MLWDRVVSIGVASRNCTFADELIKRFGLGPPFPGEAKWCGLAREDGIEALFSPGGSASLQMPENPPESTGCTMGNDISRLLFDPQDFELLTIVKDVLKKNESFRYLKNLLYPYLHPRGIKELAASKGLRIAYAAARLLDSLEVGKADERLTALRCLRDEVMHSGNSPMQNNTARVLLEIMKELVRTGDNKQQQLELAHDFRTATSGKPRIIRKLLHRYHLLEMPEEWNQVTFDDHVHDSNTKGRKSPSHLIMDAWIKGIRHLTVIYYNHVASKAAEELLEAAEIMGITVRIGVEFSTRFYDRYIQLFWVPRGFSDAHDFLLFLDSSAIKAFMEEGIVVSEYQQRYVFAILREFNERHRFDINEKYGLDLECLDVSEFQTYVGSGQASILHLAKFIHKRLLLAMKDKVAELREQYKNSAIEERQRIVHFVKEMDMLDSEAIVERYLRPVHNPNVPDPHVPQNDPDVPDLLKLSPSDLIDHLSELHAGYRITLNLSNLRAEDVIELIYDCKGAISHLEIFNLKDYITGRMPHYQEINELQRSINEGNVIALKRQIREIIQRVSASDTPHKEERLKKFREILSSLDVLKGYYKQAPLRSRIGSDSTGHSRRLHGMGLAMVETLPRRAQREIAHTSSRLLIPVRARPWLRLTYVPLEKPGTLPGAFNRALRSIPGFRLRLSKRQKDWLVHEGFTLVTNQGNIVALGGVSEETGNGLCLEEPLPKSGRGRLSWKYLNSNLKNALKVLIGLIPAFSTFYLTKDWWLLAYFGAFIWFGITGLRNILQSVLGAGGIRRSPLLKWDSYVSWDRLSDSLLYTGFSVPLLDYLVKTVLLDRGFGINTTTNPTLLFSVMALANGMYISGHNLWRGLPKGAVIGNMFRTILSIPLAIALNAVVSFILAGFGVPHIGDVLQKWAAIVSKTASDCVAGVIEGLTDRHNNICIRLRDYNTKLAQLFDTYAQMELIFSEVDVLDMLESPKNFMRKISTEARDLENIIIINALDLLYFWMYQPRARSVFCSLMQKMSHEERRILVRSQSVLRRNREISQLFVNGIVGKKFSQALSFYLDRSEGYLDTIEEIACKACRRKVLSGWSLPFWRRSKGALDPVEPGPTRVA